MFPFPAAMLGKPAMPTAFDPANTAANVTLSNSNRTIVGTNSSYGSSISLASAASGKYYFELVVGAGQAVEIGITKSGFSTTGEMVASANAVGCQIDSGANTIYVGGVAQGINLNGGVAAVAGDRWDMAIDLANKKVWFRKNGGNWNANGSADPASNVGGVDMTAWLSGAVHMAGSVQNTTSQGTFNFSPNHWLGTVPLTFDALRDA